MWSWMNILTLVDKKATTTTSTCFLLHNFLKSEVLKFSFPNWQIEWPEQGTKLSSWGIVAHFSPLSSSPSPPATKSYSCSRGQESAGAAMNWRNYISFQVKCFYTENVYVIGSWELEYYNTIDLIDKFQGLICFILVMAPAPDVSAFRFSLVRDKLFSPPYFFTRNNIFCFPDCPRRTFKNAFPI